MVSIGYEIIKANEEIKEENLETEETPLELNEEASVQETAGKTRAHARRDCAYLAVACRCAELCRGWYR